MREYLEGDRIRATESQALAQISVPGAAKCFAQVAGAMQEKGSMYEIWLLARANFDDKRRVSAEMLDNLLKDGRLLVTLASPLATPLAFPSWR